MGQAGQHDRQYDDIGEFLPKAGQGSAPVRGVLQQKARREVYTISPKASVYDALSLMAQHNIGALVVLDLGRVVGVISARHWATVVPEVTVSTGVPMISSTWVSRELFPIRITLRA